MEFDFGDKTFNFPIKSLNYYPWLKTLLENNNNVNLTDYLQDTSNENKRYIENCLKILENYYNNQEVLLINDTNLTFTESFLSKGPYSTKGLDLEYQCLKCKKKTFRIVFSPLMVISITGELQSVCHVSVMRLLFYSCCTFVLP